MSGTSPQSGIDPPGLAGPSDRAGAVPGAVTAADGAASVRAGADVPGAPIPGPSRHAPARTARIPIVATSRIAGPGRARIAHPTLRGSRPDAISPGTLRTAVAPIRSIRHPVQPASPPNASPPAGGRSSVRRRLKTSRSALRLRIVPKSAAPPRFVGTGPEPRWGRRQGTGLRAAQTNDRCVYDPTFGPSCRPADEPRAASISCRRAVCFVSRPRERRTKSTMTAS
jgi:hypothetical protein